ncbi:hypothetical protein F5Y06DRAFT_225877 [Hypoxylon sp. FL0890]|nr:hypothetical protein F5Y06DRAFT_225877 [Hypoxylon sp. FL0890]
MEHLVGIPRDQRVAWASYVRAPLSAPCSHRENWPGYSQPIDSHPRRTHRSFRPMSESSLDTPPARGGSRRRHKDPVRSLDESVWGEALEWQGPVISKHRRISQGANWDPDAAASDNVHGDSHHTSNHPRKMLPGVKETHDEGRHQAGQKGRHHTPVPPKAPMIPRLPTPDFDDADYGERDMTSHQFCACCAAEDSGETKAKRRECTVGKMERQLYEAKLYIARKDSRAR